MAVLITGGAGFLGSALANRLAAQGCHVRVLDNLSAGERERLDPRVAFASSDTRDVPKLWSLLRDVDCVHHLAARVSVPESILYPVEYNEVNVGGTVSLLTAIRDAGREPRAVKRLVFASSGAIYGERARQPIREEAPPRPLTPYAVSKAASEQYVLAIGELWGVEEAPSLCSGTGARRAISSTSTTWWMPWWPRAERRGSPGRSSTLVVGPS